MGGISNPTDPTPPLSLTTPPVRSTLTTQANSDDGLATAIRIAAESAKAVRHVAEDEADAVELILRVWEATAQAIGKDIEAGRSVSLQPLGLFRCRGSLEDFSGDIGCALDGKDISYAFVPSGAFLLRYGLECDVGAENVSTLPGGPHVRFSTAGIARTTEVDRDVVQRVLSAMIHHLGETMSKCVQLTMSFAPLGNLLCRERHVLFETVRRRSPLVDAQPTLPTVRAALLGRVRPSPRSGGAPSPRLPPAKADSMSHARGASSGRRGSWTQRLRARDGVHAQEEYMEPQQLMEGTFHRGLPSHSVRYPPLLNECSRTLAVPYTGAQETGSPSGRIASSYAGSAAWLTSRVPGVSKMSLRWMPELEKQIDHVSPHPDRLVLDGSSLDAELRDAGLSRASFYECLHRYSFYLREGVPNAYIAPFDPAWSANISALLDVRRLTPELSSGRVDEMLAEMHAEVLDDYFRALKKAIVDHIFSDEHARQRANVLFVPVPPVVWGTVPFVGVEGTHGGPPDEWRAGIGQSRASIAGALATCSRSSLSLLELWHQEFDGFLLVDLAPRTASGLSELDAFCTKQSMHSADVRKQFEGAWLSKVVEILRAPRSDVCAIEEPAFYEAVCALLSTQMRSVVERSIEAYVGFFRRFAKEGPMTPNHVVGLADSDEREDAFLVLGLTAQFGDIRFCTSLEQVAERLLDIFRSFVVCLRGLERPDAKLGKGPSTTHLWEVSFEEQHVGMAENFIAGVIHLNLANVKQALMLYDDYKHLLHEELRIRELAENLTLTREDYIAQVDKLRATEAAIRENCPSEIRLQMISVDCAEINETLCRKAGEAVHILLHAVLRNLLLKNDQLVKSFEAVVNHMVKKPTSEVELVDLEAHVDEFRATGLKGLLGEFASIHAWLGFLFECEDRLCWAMLSMKHYRAIYDSACWVHSIDGIVSEREANLRREREALESKFMEQRNKFVEDLEGFNAFVEKFRDCGNLRQVDDYLERIQVLRNHFTRAHQEAQHLNHKEQRLGWEPSNFEQLRVGEQALEKYHRLWTAAYNLDKATKQWLRGPLFQLDPVKVEAEAESIRREAEQLRELFDEQDQPNPAAVAGQLGVQVSMMITSHLGLVRALCNKGLRQRHWDQISDIVGFSMEPDNVFTLQRIIEMDVGKHVIALRSISEAATNEHNIECALDAMQAEWRPVQFDLQPWRDTGTHVLSKCSLEEMTGLVEEHLVKTRAMSKSPHVVPWAQRVAELEEWLKLTAQILKHWVRLQNMWTYLEPVFSGQDILRQMPTEGQLFRKVNKMWRGLVATVGEQKAALHATKEEGLCNQLVTCCGMLEEVQKGLDDYLESKRLTFPRFFFLSNGELLEIIADVQIPARVQIHLRKCFSGIYGLQFLRERHDAGSAKEDSHSQPMSSSPSPLEGSGHEGAPGFMVSSQGEVVAFGSPLEWESEDGAEEWFTEVESAMRSATRRICIEALQARANVPRSRWVLESPTQAVLCASAVLWTQDTTTAILGSSLPELHVRLDRELAEIVHLVGSDVPPLVRATLEALIVLDLHDRDVVQFLFGARVASEDDFEWVKHLRYYVSAAEDEELGSNRLDASCDLFSVTLDAHLSYGYEYLGNCSRLVPTPLTDRIFRTLCSALHLRYGGALEGPSGTGKSETVKDLAKATARMCVCFNCFDAFDGIAISRFFKGSASSGAWCCFDEFDRVDVEVLSVVAQQILTVQQAIIRQLAHFEFEGTMLQLRGGFIAVTLSMYGVRSKLPDNLKALLRPAMMMVPNVSAIVVGKLSSFGFRRTRELATKLVHCYSLCEDQLSNQSHYEHGLRAVLSVTALAGRLALTSDEEDEAALVLRAIMDVNLAKLVPSDREGFWDIVGDLFPQVTTPRTEYTALRRSFKECVESNGLGSVGYLEAKVLHLYDVLAVRHGLLAVGQTHAAKTTSILTLAGMLTDMAEGGIQDERPVKLATVSPQALTAGQLFGCYIGREHEWSEGVLVAIFRQFCKDGEGRHWLHLDGPVDAAWAESLNTVLDDTRKLCVLSGETIEVPLDMKIIVESLDLAAASPATVGRCGTVFFSPEQMGYWHLVEAWSECPKTLTKEERDEMTNMLGWLVPPLLECARTQMGDLVVPFQEQSLTQAVLYALNSFLCPLRDEECCNHVRTNSIEDHCDAAVLLACIWGIGAAAEDESGRKAFDVSLRTLVDNLHPSATAYKKLHPPFPRTGTCFDQAWNDELGHWCGWLEFYNEPQVFDPRQSPCQTLVRTEDTARYIHLGIASCHANVSILVRGPMGTGKSAYMTEVLHDLRAPDFQTVKFAFSAWADANEIQDAVDGSLDKRECDAYGPPPGSTCILFFDDINLPIVNPRRAQPLELLRQLCCFEGWYDRKDAQHNFRRIVDCTLAGTAALGSTGHGEMSPRFLRHFHVIGILPFSSSILAHIFAAIVSFRLSLDFYPQEVENCYDDLVGATLELYTRARERLAPLPSRPQYALSICDFARVISGLLQLQVREATSEMKCTRLWVHECLREFADRLVDDRDRNCFLDAMRESVQAACAWTLDDDILRTPRRLIFSDIASPLEAAGRAYDEVVDLGRAQEVVEESLERFNALAEIHLGMVMFPYAVEHLLRIVRILRVPHGSALLIGTAGTGRRSLSHLAAFMVGQRSVDFKTSHANGGWDAWRNDLREMLLACGGQGKPATLVFGEARVNGAAFQKDLHALLCDGDVPDLWSPEDSSAIAQLMSTREKPFRGGSPDKESETEGCDDGGVTTGASPHVRFASRCSECLHIVICLPPTGAVLREMFRSMPVLLNRCVVDWFDDWPASGLVNVTERLLSEGDATLQPVAAYARVCHHIHSTSATLTKRLLAEFGQHHFVASRSCICLARTFAWLATERREEAAVLHDRYTRGLEGFSEMVAALERLRVSLEKLRGRMSEQHIQIGQTVASTTANAETLDNARQTVAAEEAAATDFCARAASIKDDCERCLEQAVLEVQEAMRGLDTLTAADIAEIRSIKNPSEPVKKVLEAVGILKGQKSVRIRDDMTSIDSWIASQKMVADAGFFQSLQKFDRDKISPDATKRIMKLLEDEDLQPSEVERSSKAIVGLFSWLRAVLNHDMLAKSAKSKQEALATAQAEFQEVKMQLDQKREDLVSVETSLEQQRKRLEEQRAEMAKLQVESQACEQKMQRVSSLVASMRTQQSQWREKSSKKQDELQCIGGNMLAAAGVITYLGMFPAVLRREALVQWAAEMFSEAVPHDAGFSMASGLAEDERVHSWVVAGLPTDPLSIENGVITFYSPRCPICVDPQGEASKWLKNIEGPNGLLVLSAAENKSVGEVESLMQCGAERSVLLEGVGEELDPRVERILDSRAFLTHGRARPAPTSSQRWSSASHRSPTLFITTSLSNPRFSPETCVRAALVNFTVTREGLHDQLLNIAATEANPDLRQERIGLILESAKGEAELRELECKIIGMLASSSGSLLEEKHAIESLCQSIELSENIARQQLSAVENDRWRNNLRSTYTVEAAQSSVLFFALMKLSYASPMYQSSLGSFVRLFSRSCATAEVKAAVEGGRKLLVENFLRAVYSRTTRSLFAQHRPLLAILLAAELGLVASPPGAPSALTLVEYQFLLTGAPWGPTGTHGRNDDDAPSADMLVKPVDWIDDEGWSGIRRLAAMPGFEGLDETFAEHRLEWRDIFDSDCPHRVTFPGAFGGLTKFQKILVLRCIRLDRVTDALVDWASGVLGIDAMSTAPCYLASAYVDSSETTPIVLVLAAGADPLSLLLQFAGRELKEMRMVSMGQGQGARAEAIIEEAKATGAWVLLQNCHLALSWMPYLTRICELLMLGLVNPDFRLWLSSCPSPAFPPSVLKAGVTIAVEPPRGLKCTMQSLLAANPLCESAFFDGCTDCDALWKRLLYTLLVFHGTVVGRGNYRSQGWRVPYEFADSDFQITIQQVQSLINTHLSKAPAEALRCLVVECNHGARITDSQDRFLLKALLESCFVGGALQPAPPVWLPDAYNFPQAMTYEGFRGCIDGLPDVELPAAYGLHANADIAKQRNAAIALLGDALQGFAYSKLPDRGGRVDEDIAAHARLTISRLPSPFDTLRMQPTDVASRAEQFDVVLHQEILRYNLLLEVIRTSLHSIVEAVEGRAAFRCELEAVADSMTMQRVPERWRAHSYLSLKPLGGYLRDLTDRIGFLRAWLEEGTPCLIWISGLFSIPPLLTAVRQKFARKHKSLINLIEFEFGVLEREPMERPDDAVYLSGLFLEGCRWHPGWAELAESEAHILFTPCPLISLLPRAAVADELGLDDFGKADDCTYARTAAQRYDCPVYVISSHNLRCSASNFVFWISLPSISVTPSHWVIRGAAALTQLDV